MEKSRWKNIVNHIKEIDLHEEFTGDQVARPQRYFDVVPVIYRSQHDTMLQQDLDVLAPRVDELHTSPHESSQIQVCELVPADGYSQQHVTLQDHLDVLTPTVEKLHASPHESSEIQVFDLVPADGCSQQDVVLQQDFDVLAPIVDELHASPHESSEIKVFDLVPADGCSQQDVVLQQDLDVLAPMVDELHTSPYESSQIQVCDLVPADGYSQQDVTLQDHLHVLTPTVENLHASPHERSEIQVFGLVPSDGCSQQDVALQQDLDVLAPTVDELHTSDESSQIQVLDLVPADDCSHEDVALQQDLDILTPTPEELHISADRNAPSPPVIPLPPEREVPEGQRCPEDEQHQRRKRKGKENWKKNINIAKRQRGEDYEGRKRNGDKNEVIEKSGRKMKPGCGGSSCKSKQKQCALVSEEQRKELFKCFWVKMTWPQRKVYIANVVTSMPVKRRTCENETRRKATLMYHLKVESDLIPVCKKLFLDTFCLGEWTVRNWVQTSECGMHSSPTYSPRPYNNKRLEQREGLTTFFAEYPKLPSHYCRAGSSKLYLESMAKSVAELYREYKEYFCVERNIEQPASIITFTQKMKDSKISLFKPKKDQCDTCVGYETGNIPEDVYQIHIIRKNMAREQMTRDTETARIDNTTKVFTFDAQGVMLSPYLQASAVYFKTKLIVHNFTIFNNVSHEVDCYVWHEAEGDVTANEYTTCIIDTLKKNLTNTKTIILWSDGCTSQNRNQTLSNALLQFSFTHKIKIIHNYLEKGHTQMPCDSIHSLIERKKKNININVPADYVNIIENARKNPSPYKVNYLKHTFFKNFAVLDMVKSIRPGNKTGDPVVTDIRSMHYNDIPNIQYKLHYEDDWENLPRRIAHGNIMREVPQLYLERRKIQASKKKHLMDLKAVIPNDYHSFYDDLPSQ